MSDFLNSAHVVLHLSMHVHYLTSAKWEKDWIDTAVDLAEKCWTNHYKPSYLETRTSVAEPLDNNFPFGLNMSVCNVAPLDLY